MFWSAVMYAAMLYGSSLLTRDVDVCTPLTPANVERLRATLHDLHPQHRLSMPGQSFIDSPPPGTAPKNLYLSTDWGALDLLGSITGIGGFARVARNAVDVELFGRHVHVIGLDDLIAAKEALGRDKDLIAARELRAIREKLRGK